MSASKAGTCSSDELREVVSRSYAQALRAARAAGGGCCGGPMPAGTAAKAAGYGRELEAYPTAGASSFGCGNPLAFAAVEPGQTVLDLGSGAGLDLLIASDCVGPSGRVIGIDMTDEMIAEARANARRADRCNVEVRQGIIEDLPVEDASVDWVISNCVVNLSPEKDRVFREIHRVLKPGGRISISDIVAEDLPAALLDHPQAWAACVSGATSEREYVAGLVAAGLVDVRVIERQTYDGEQIRALAESDLAAAGLEPEALVLALRDAEGKVASVRVEGRRP